MHIIFFICIFAAHILSMTWKFLFGGFILSLFCFVQTPCFAQDDTREYWISQLEKLAGPIMESMAHDSLKEKMPVSMNQDYQYLQPEHYRYYRGCIEEANKYLLKSEAADFRNWIRRRGKLQSLMQKAANYYQKVLSYANSENYLSHLL